MKQEIKKHFSGHVHQNIIKKIIENTPEKERTMFLSFAIQCYTKYRNHRTIMRNNNIHMESFFDKSHKNRKMYSKKNFEYFSDAVEKTLILQEVNVIEHRIKTKQSEHLFNNYTRQIIEDLVVAEFSKYDIQESIGKKINSFSDVDDFANALYNLFEQKINWSKDYYLNLIKNSNLENNVDYIIRYEDDNTLNIEIISYEASKLLGVKMWCLVREYMHFEDYRRSSKNFLVFSYDFKKSFSDLNSIVATLFDCNLNIVESYLKNDDYWDEYSDIEGFKSFEDELQKKVFPDKANWCNSFLKCLNDPMIKHEIMESGDYNLNSNSFLESIFSSFSCCLEPIPIEVFNHPLIKYNSEHSDKEITIYDIHKENKKIKTTLKDLDETFLLDRIDYTNGLTESDKIKLFSWLKNDNEYNQNGLHIRMLNNAIRHEHLSLLNLILFQHLNKLKEEFNSEKKQNLFKNTFKLMIDEPFEKFEPFMVQFLNIYTNKEKNKFLTTAIEYFESNNSEDEKSMFFNFIKKESISKIDPQHIENTDELFKHFILNPKDMLDIFRVESKDDLFYIYDILFVKVLDGSTSKRLSKISKNKLFSINKSDLIQHCQSLGTKSKGLGYSFLFGISFTNSLINGNFEKTLKMIKEQISDELFYSSLREYFIMEQNILFNFTKQGLRISQSDESDLVIKKGLGFYKMLNIPYKVEELSEQILGLEKTDSSKKTFFMGKNGFEIGEVDYKKEAKRILNYEFIAINI